MEYRRLLKITNYGLAWMVPNPPHFEETPHYRPCLLANTCRDVQNNVTVTQNLQVFPDSEGLVKTIRARCRCRLRLYITCRTNREHV